ncbi:MAG: hypothetical protein EOP00_03050 [Pedobacter sp.]|nr:MAG: hypothetical protein EOP00_03050 [Pedobacter sp.]
MSFIILLALLSSCATQSYQIVDFPTRNRIKTKVDSLSVEKYEGGIRKWVHTPVGRFAYEGVYHKGAKIDTYIKPFMMKVK